MHPVDHRFIGFRELDGMFAQAQVLGYDLLLFTGVYNIHTDRDYNDYHRGLDNIYTLPAVADLDAFILAGDRVKSEEIIRAVDAQLAGRSIPKLVLNHPMPGYINVYPEQAEYVYRIVKHLIEVHGCRNIYCMVGTQGEVTTTQRLMGFRRAMHEAGLPCPEEIIFYGNFWEEYPFRFGRDIAAGKVERPDAVVCQSDNMAAALITGLQEGGLSVRRLTPVECARLQGFPDWWCADLAISDPTDADIAFWSEVWETWRQVTNPSGKPKTEKQIRRWLADPYTDSAEYKLWGNGISLPIAFFVLAGIKWAAQRDTQE